MNTNGQQTKAVSKTAQRGSSAVEFAFVFPILFLLVYGVIVYSYVYVIQQSITYGAQQAAESAVAVNPQSVSGRTLEDRTRDRVNAVAAQSVGWLSASQRTRLSGINGTPAYAAFDTVDTDQSIVRVTVEFSLDGLFPSLELPFVGNVPPLPTRLRAQAIARI